MATQVPQAGWNQQTAAVRQMLSQFSGTRSSSSKRASRGRSTASRTGGAKKRRKRAASSKTRKRASSRTAARLVKGSKAAKAWMAKIRRKRK